MSYTEVVPLYNKKSGKFCRAVNKVLTCTWGLRNTLYIGAGILFIGSVVGFISAATVGPAGGDPKPYDPAAHFFLVLGITVAIPYLLNLMCIVFGRVKFILYEHGSYTSNGKSKEVLYGLHCIESNLWDLRESLNKKSYAKSYVDRALNAIWEIMDESLRYAEMTNGLDLDKSYDKDKPLKEYLALAEEIKATANLLVFRSISITDSAHLQVIAMELQNTIDSVDELSALHIAA